VTWGQLRLQLQIFGPGVSADLLDEFLNGRYEQVLEATDWSGLKYHTTIQTLAAYQSTTDTVTFTVGSASVAGAGTAWTSAITGLKIYRPGDTVIYTATYAGSTSLTLDRPYEGNGTDAAGTAYTASPYVLMQNVYPLPSDCRSPVTVLDPNSGLPLDGLSKAQLDKSAGVRTLIGDPECYALYDDTPEGTPPVLHQIEFYPPPLRARGFPVQYTHAATGFDGGNTSGSPLPFVSTTVLLYGCRADIAAHLENWEGAKVYEAKYQEELAKLLRVEHGERRTAKPVLRMAGRFTRHRLARSARGFYSNWRGGTPGGPD
jgi:hypothetical protein